MKERTKWIISATIVWLIASTIILLGMFAPTTLGYITIGVLITAALLGVTVLVKMFLFDIFN